MGDDCVQNLFETVAEGSLSLWCDGVIVVCAMLALIRRVWCACVEFYIQQRKCEETVH
jgi:hypothetical protein